jgi:hypothetical protein
MATAKKSSNKKPVKKTVKKPVAKKSVKATSSVNSLDRYTAFEKMGVVLFAILAVSFLFLIIARFM